MARKGFGEDRKHGSKGRLTSFIIFSSLLTIGWETSKQLGVFILLPVPRIFMEGRKEGNKIILCIGTFFCRNKKKWSVGSWTGGSVKET